MSKLKTVNIKGKEYVEVHTRIQEFHRLYTNGSIQSTFERVDLEDDVLWIVVAKVIPDVANPERYFTGHAQELESASFINKTSALENAETSAWGRAMSALNIGIDVGIASADEVNKAINRSSAGSKAKPAAKTVIAKDMWFCKTDFKYKDEVKALEGATWVKEKKVWGVSPTDDNRMALGRMNAEVYDINGEVVEVGMTKAEEKQVDKEAFDFPF